MIELPVIWLCETDAAGGAIGPPAVRDGGSLGMYGSLETETHPHPSPLPKGEGTDGEGADREGTDGEGAEWVFLSGNEQRILAGMRFEKRRREWLLGRRVAKKLLCGRFGCAPGELSIEPEEGGAPVVWRDGEWLPGCLTISHSGDSAFCAWTDVPGLRIGADLEQVGEVDPEWMRDYLTAAEWGTRLEQGAHWPYLAWSAKEAVLKALRIGLRVDTREIEIRPGDGREMAGWKPLDLWSELVEGECWIGWRKEADMLLTMALITNPT